MSPQPTDAERHEWYLEDLWQDQQAEASYADMLAHPESVVDAPDVF